MEDKGFFGTLFDLSFSEFITIKVIKVIYILLLVLIGIGYLIGIITGFVRGFGAGLLAMILGALVAFLYILGARIGMETIIVLFRIAENTQEITERGRIEPSID